MLHGGLYGYHASVTKKASEVGREFRGAEVRDKRKREQMEVLRHMRAIADANRCQFKSGDICPQCQVAGSPGLVLDDGEGAYCLHCGYDGDGRIDAATFVVTTLVG